MTELLKQAFERASELSSDEQDALARRILAELDAEMRWNALLADSQDLLAEWADEALTEHLAGKTIPVERKDRKK